MKTNDNAVQQNSTTPLRTFFDDFEVEIVDFGPKPITLFLGKDRPVSNDWVSDGGLRWSFQCQ